MKKAISLLLALVLCLSLCACGGGNDTPDTIDTNAPEEAVPTKEELLAQALTVDYTTINNRDSSPVLVCSCLALCSLCGTDADVLCRRKQKRSRIKNGR